MNSYTLLFHLASLGTPFLDQDDASVILTLETNRLRWRHLPYVHGDKVSFATGYVMGREEMDRDPRLTQGQNPGYDLGYECGVRVIRGEAPTPAWDCETIEN